MMLALLDWLELHIAALRLGVSADWLRDARERAERLFAAMPEPLTLEEKQRHERRDVEHIWTADDLARLDAMHALEREAANGQCARSA